MKGTVKWYNTKKGYGFIVAEDGDEYFIHHTVLPKKMKLLENVPVSFDGWENDRGKQASNIILEDN